MEKISAPVNSTIRKANTINGTKGISVLEKIFFPPSALCMYIPIPNNAPIHTERRMTNKPSATPKNAPTPKKRTTSPKPNAFPFENIHTTKKGNEITSGPKNSKLFGSCKYRSISIKRVNRL